MSTTAKTYDLKIAPFITQAKEAVLKKYGIKTGNNANLICQKALELKDTEGVIVECGVFSGSTIFAVAEFCQQNGIDKQIIGFDSFTGFPYAGINPKDHPERFKDLLQEGRISEEHFKKAAARTKNFTDTSHLTKEYFADVKAVFAIAKQYPRIRFIEGAFAKTMPNFNEPISVLYLDCDLYQSYLDALTNLYDLVIPGGVMIFDEYYSLKYPGARMAVDEFFRNKEGKFEYYLTDEGFERWAFIKA